MQIAALIFSLLPCVLIIFQEFALKNTSFYKFESTFIHLDEEQFALEKFKQMFGVAAGFMVNLPYLAIICMEAVIFFHSNFVLWDVHLAPAQIKFNSLKAMKALGQVDSIVCSKSAFVNTSH